MILAYVALAVACILNVPVFITTIFRRLSSLIYYSPRAIVQSVLSWWVVTLVWHFTMKGQIPVLALLMGAVIFMYYHLRANAKLSSLEMHPFSTENERSAQRGMSLLFINQVYAAVIVGIINPIVYGSIKFI